MEDTAAQIKTPLVRQAEPDPTDIVTVDESRWSTGLCSCCAQPGGGALGCVSLFMPCVQYGVLAEQLPKGSTWVACDCCAAGCAFGGLDALASLLSISLWPGVNLIPTSALAHMELRRHLRTKYGIKGTCFGDLCTTWWCGPCALAQETREMVIRARRQQLQQEAGAGAGQPPHQQAHLFGHMFMVPPNVIVAPFAHAAADPSAARVYVPVGHLLFQQPLAPATGLPVGYGVVPPPPPHEAAAIMAQLMPRKDGAEAAVLK